MKVLMVCLGNICRSPLAEGILKAQSTAAGLDWTIDSAGTSAYHIGNLPDPRSIQTANRHGIDITDQRARQIQAEDLEEFDLILAMDQSNYNSILRLSKNEAQREKVKMILNFVHPTANDSVPDPYWDDNGFEHVFELLDTACEKVIDTYR